MQTLLNKNFIKNKIKKKSEPKTIKKEGTNARLLHKVHLLNNMRYS